MRDGGPLQVSKDADTWTVTANGNEHYRFADALIPGGLIGVSRSEVHSSS